MFSELNLPVFRHGEAVVGGEKGDGGRRRVHGPTEGGVGESGCLITAADKSLMQSPTAALFPRRPPENTAK